MQAKAVFRAERDGGLGDDLAGGVNVEAEALGQDCQDEGGFHYGEGVADTSSGATAEGKIGEAREIALEGIGPAHGIEARGIGEIARVAMRDPLADDHARSARNAVAGQSALGGRHAHDAPGGGIEAHGFF